MKVVELRAQCALERRRVPATKIAKLASSAKVGTRQLNKLVKIARLTGTLMRKKGSGRPRIATTLQMKRWFEKKAKEFGGAWTSRQMADEMKKQWH
jgi:hypothetical protein